MLAAFPSTRLSARASLGLNLKAGMSGWLAEMPRCNIK
jgi:hypothetical protein